MPSTGINNGTLGVIKVGGVTVSHLTNVEFSRTMATRDATTKDSGGHEEVLEGLLSAEGSASGYFAEDAAYGFEDLEGKMVDRETVLVRWTTGVTGDKYREAQCYITSLSKTDPLEESSTFEVSFKPAVKPTIGTEA